MLDYVDDMVLVSETRLRAATRWLATHLGLLVEAAGAAGVAALQAEPDRYRGRSVLTPLCGGHLPPDAFQWTAAWRE